MCLIVCFFDKFTPRVVNFKDENQKKKGKNVDSFVSES